KYWLRPLTRRMDKRRLLSGIRMAMPVLFPVTEVLFRLPAVGRLFRFTVPVANYVEAPLSARQRYRWAVMDTFDMLAPEYDQPQEEASATAVLGRAGVTAVRRLPTGGLNLIGQKT